MSNQLSLVSLEEARSKELTICDTPRWCSCEGCGTNASWVLLHPNYSFYTPVACDRHKYFLQEVVDGKRGFNSLLPLTTRALVPVLLSQAEELSKRIRAMPPHLTVLTAQGVARQLSKELVTALKAMGDD